jgi:hypothetical protein
LPGHPLERKEQAPHQNSGELFLERIACIEMTEGGWGKPPLQFAIPYFFETKIIFGSIRKKFRAEGAVLKNVNFLALPLGPDKSDGLKRRGWTTVDFPHSLADRGENGKSNREDWPERLSLQNLT